jgi:quercetin dioxygenase-like cupin family protein
MKHLINSMLFTCIFLGFASAAMCQKHGTTADTSMHSFNLQYEQLKWDKMQPQLGERSAEMTILHVDPKTQATQLMIRMPKNFHVPLHWHSANETHTVISGTFVIKCEGVTDTLRTGSFNYVPSKMFHEASTTAAEGALLFITCDAGFDINWVGGNPKPEDFILKEK